MSSKVSRHAALVIGRVILESRIKGSTFSFCEVLALLGLNLISIAEVLLTEYCSVCKQCAAQNISPTP
jgi:hypothetical protein